MGNRTRPPIVAGRFYPGDAQSLRYSIQKMSPPATRENRKVTAAIAPHAGYVYSGAVAAETFAHIDIPDTVVLLGPNHTGQGAAAALSTADWETPFGTVTSDHTFSSALLQETDLIAEDDLAHQYEHSLEVQLPFLQMAREDFSIVPITLSRLPYKKLYDIGSSIARAVRKSQKEVLMVASSDMTHYESRSSASRKDHFVLDILQKMDPEILYRSVIENNISMCGIIPVTVTLIAALELGAQKTEIVRYADSGEVSGDTDQVVGYAGVLIW